MDLKNLMSHVVRPVNRTTTEELPATEFQLSAQDELVQLSEEELRKINGGDLPVGGFVWLMN
jgi:hypothetical protein